MKRCAAIALACLLTAGMLLPQARTHAQLETASDSQQQALQEGLTLYEIDRELERITEQEKSLQLSLAGTQDELIAAEMKARTAREHAAKVLRAYHMGERDALWLLLLNIDSLSDAFTTLEYLQMILNNDRTLLQRHKEEQQRLSSVKQQLQDEQASLAQLKQRYEEQRERALEAEKTIQAVLAAASVAEAVQIKQQMEQLNQRWREEGIPLFQTYFKALASAMNQLPDLISQEGAPSNLFKLSGVNASFSITDEQLNQFLKQKNEMFNHMSFRFTPEQIIADGTYNDISLSMKGTYELSVKPMKNGTMADYVRYRIDELKFNGFVLPSTTVQELEKQFDLGIYPQNVVSFLKVTGVEMEEGRVTILMQIAF